MWSLKSVGAVATTGATLAALTGLALADEAPAEEPVEVVVSAIEIGDHDSIFNFGFDEKFQLFVWNLTGPSSTLNCSVGNGPVETTYSVGDDEEISVDALTRDGVDIGFAELRPTEGTEEGTDDPGPESYSPTEECGLRAAEVAGPNGQINHGMFMKLFNSVYEGSGRGCINRELAQHGLGKGDQQVRVGDLDPDFESILDSGEGEGGFDMTTIAADCERGRDRDETGKPEKAETGKPEKAETGKPEKAPRTDKPGRGPDKAPEGRGKK